MRLPQVDRQVRRPSRVNRVEAKRRGAERPPDPVEDLRGSRLHPRPQADRPQLRAEARRIGVDLGGSDTKVGAQPGDQGVDRAEMRQRVSVIPPDPDRREKGTGGSERTAVPAGRHPRPAVPETGSIEVGPRSPDRNRLHT